MILSVLATATSGDRIARLWSSERLLVKTFEGYFGHLVRIAGPGDYGMLKLKRSRFFKRVTVGCGLE